MSVLEVLSNRLHIHRRNIIFHIIAITIIFYKYFAILMLWMCLVSVMVYLLYGYLFLYDPTQYVSNH